MITRIARAGVIAALAVATIAGCGSDDRPAPEPTIDPCASASASTAPSSAASAPPAVTKPEPCDPAEEQVIAGIARNTPECDREDRAHHEVPDCGFRLGKTYIEWSWVKAGKKKPPARWDVRVELRAGARSVTSTQIGIRPSATPARVSSPAAPAAPRTQTATTAKPTTKATTTKRRP